MFNLKLIHFLKWSQGCKEGKFAGKDIHFEQVL